MKTFNYLLYFCLFSCSISLQAQRKRLFTPEDGLSNSHISQIYQDSRGYIWIATENGLNKFNGFDFTVYSEQPGDLTSLKGNYVHAVYEDSRGTFWVGTMSGLMQYDREKDTFHPFVMDKAGEFYLNRVNWILEDKKGNIWVSYPENGVICLDAKTRAPTFFNKHNSGIGENNINCSFEDKYGNLWLGTEDNGVYVFNKDNQSIRHFYHIPNNSKSISSNKIFAICEDLNGRVWVGTLGGGISIFDSFTGTFSTIKTEDSPMENFVYSFCRDRSGTIWVGTDGAGIIRYDASGKKMAYWDEISDVIDLQKAKVHHIFEDKQGNIWIALYQKGVLFVPASDRQFQNYGFNSFNPSKSIGTHCVTSIVEDSEGNIWAGTDGDGLYLINQKHNQVVHYTVDNTPGFRSNVITALFEDNDRNIWIGTYVNGFFRYNRKDKIFDSPYQQTDSSNGLSNNHVIAFVQDKTGALWIGTNGGGVNRFNIHNRQFEHYLYQDNDTSGNQLSSNWVYSLLIDRDETIWVGTSNGVNHFDPHTGTFIRYYSLNEAITSNLVYTLHQDEDENIWAGGFFGLHRINKKTGKIVRITTLDGLPNNMINGIEEDENRLLWISTGHGLCRYDPKNGECLNLYSDDGIQSGEFRRGSHFKGEGGRLYFGGINGITTFYPAQITYEDSLLGLAFTDFLIYNEPVLPGKSGILTHSLDETKSVRLKYNQRSFTFMFAALEYGIPKRVVYYTQMENFDKQWRKINNPNRRVTYTNLDPGTYIFKVRATLDGNHFLQKEIQVIIEPPFWLTVWAKIIYIILLLLAAYSLYAYISIRLRQRRELMEKEQQKQISESKLQFFTDISHEIRTPLTLIIGPVESLLKVTSDSKLQSTYGIIHQNAIRILRLINQLMDLRAVEKGKLKLRVEKTAVDDFARKIMNSFHNLATSRQIDFQLIVKEVLPEIYIDRDCLDKIIFNLLSNAFKFTPQGGRIAVCLNKKNDQLEIEVQDSGIGIAKEMQEKVFDRFYQIHDERYKSSVGTGVGLHLTKMMVELHHGYIRLESEPDKGSCFVVQLPLFEDVYTSEEFGYSDGEAPVTMFQPSVPMNGEKNSSGKSQTRFSLLVVEDDVDILNYIQSELSLQYKMITADNGKEGLVLALKFLPDVIISDIIMPQMDGLTLCKVLKSNEKTCHIPVILLTAKTSVEQRIEGLEMGADSYIPKPFNIRHLQTRVEQLIQLRETLKQKYRGSLEIKTENIQVVSADEKLLTKLNEKIKEQVGNPDLSVEWISKELGISRVHLNRRLKTLMNESPGSYIRHFRLKQAAWLLTNKKMTIAEVAYAVGFSSHAYFSIAFKEQYGMTPSEYAETHT